MTPTGVAKILRAAGVPKVYDREKIAARDGAIVRCVLEGVSRRDIAAFFGLSMTRVGVIIRWNQALGVLPGGDDED